MSNEFTIDAVSNVDRSARQCNLPRAALRNSILHLQFPALRSRHVYIRDEVAVLDTINAIRQGGANNLQVRVLTYVLCSFCEDCPLIQHSLDLRLLVQIVTDFDLTVTKQHIDGRHVLSSFGK